MGIVSEMVYTTSRFKAYNCFLGRKFSCNLNRDCSELGPTAKHDEFGIFVERQIYNTTSLLQGKVIFSCVFP